MWQKCPECVKIVKVHDQGCLCGQCIKAARDHPVMFRSKVAYQLCFYHWVLRHPTPVRSRHGEIAQSARAPGS